jgi:hypothetical protein
LIVLIEEQENANCSPIIGHRSPIRGFATRRGQFE